jgi:hypothetical protein
VQGGHTGWAGKTWLIVLLQAIASVPVPIQYPESAAAAGAAIRVKFSANTRKQMAVNTTTFEKNFLIINVRGLLVNRENHLSTPSQNTSLISSSSFSLTLAALA